MARRREFRVLVATDGSDHARAALATAARFPWPERSRAQGLVARQVRVGYRRSILLTALDRSAHQTAAAARRALARRWSATEVEVVDMALYKPSCTRPIGFRRTSSYLAGAGTGPCVDS